MTLRMRAVTSADDAVHLLEAEFVVEAGEILDGGDHQGHGTLGARAVSATSSLDLARGTWTVL